MYRACVAIAIVVLTVLVAACGGGGPDTADGLDAASAGERAPREESRADAGGAPETVEVAEPDPVVAGVGAPLEEQFLPGNGDGIVSFEASGGLVLVDFGYTGTGRFTVRVRPAGDGQVGDLLVDTSGPWAGTLALPFEAGAFELNVTTEGVWFASVRHPDEGPIEPGAYQINPDVIGGWLPAPAGVATALEGEDVLFFQGGGTTVSPPFRLAGTVAAALLHRGSGAVTVWLVDAAGQFGELFSGLAGAVETSVALDVPAGVYRVAVTSEGSWTVAVGPR